jgi:hypothetical protein
MTVLLKKDASQPSPQGGGLNPPVAPLSHDRGGAVPLVFSPLAGEMAGRAEGD